MKIVFMGTPEYVIPSLEFLIAAPFAEIVGVYTQPDKPVGRRGTAEPPPVGRYCKEQRLPLFQPPSLRNENVQRELSVLEPEVVVVAAYGKILPTEVLDIPRYGSLNIHPSLLPRHRGPSPVVTALLQGDQTTGVTVMVVDEGMDSGPIVAQITTDVGPKETAAELTARLFEAGGELMCSVLPLWVASELKPVDQDESLATFTRKIAKEDGEADWTLPSERLARKVSAFYPWPSLYTFWQGKVLKATKARPVPASGAEYGAAGTVVLIQDNKAAVVTGDGLLVLDELQLEGRRPMDADEFTRGQRDFVGSVLPS